MEKIAFELNTRFNGPITQPGSGGVDPGTIVTNTIDLAFVIAGIIVLFMFVLGGYGLISGAGSGNPDSAAKGKKAITYAITGFLVVFTAFWVIQLIEYLTGNTGFVTSPSI